jgi:hypothetical protein
MMSIAIKLENLETRRKDTPVLCQITVEVYTQLGSSMDLSLYKYMTSQLHYL